MKYIMRAVVVASAISLVAISAQAQGTSAASPAHPPVCGKGVRVYTERSQIPVPFDTLSVPRSATPIRVTSPEEAEAAELAVRTRAGSVGATGVLISEEVQEDGGGQRVRRTVTGLYVPADSAKAQAACKA